jgi:phage shock protein E
MKQILLAALLTLGCAGAFAKTVLIDVRTPEEFASGHLEGAINIDHQQIGEQISRAGVSKEDELILYCRSGRRSALAFDTLKAKGYARVQDFGSMDAARKKLCKQSGKTC